MSTRTIPSVKVVTCDICRRDRSSNDYKEAYLAFNTMGYVGGKKMSDQAIIDLCDSCEELISIVIANETNRIRALLETSTLLEKQR